MPDVMTPMPDVMTPEEVALELRLSPWTVRKYCRTHRIPAQALGEGNGNRWRIFRRDVDAFLGRDPDPEGEEKKVLGYIPKKRVPYMQGLQGKQGAKA